MRVIFPLAFLCLIAIPVLIIIYLIKSKYNETTISSTYIWELSEKFQKKKNPFVKINGLLSLILQCLIVLFISLTMAGFQIIIPNSAKDYLLIIDQSASMNIDNNGKTRFDVAKEKMIDLINNTYEGSTYTLITNDSDTSLLINKETNKDIVKKKINSLNVSTLPGSIDSAITMAQNYFLENNALNIYLFTDYEILETSNMTVVQVNDVNAYNASITNSNFTFNEDKTIFFADVISYRNTKDLSVKLTIDGEEIETKTISCTANEKTTFEFTTECETFDEVIFELLDKDSLLLDNESIIYNNTSTNNYKTLIVSSSPFYIERILKALNCSQIDEITYANYNSAYTGYDLYVFDGNAPSKLPTDGTVWLFNIKNNVSNAGFVTNGTVNLPTGGQLEISKDNSNLATTLKSNLMGDKIYVSSFSTISLATYNDFALIYTYQSLPMIFAGTTNSGNREVVFSFDLHDSNFPLLLDFIILFKNLVNYSIPCFASTYQFVCGDTAVLNVLPNCTNIKIFSPTGIATSLSVANTVVDYTFTEIGTYQANVIISGETKEYYIYVSYPSSEADTFYSLNSLGIVGEKKEYAMNSTYDCTLILFIILICICLAEWEVYCYEQNNIR